LKEEGKVKMAYSISHAGGSAQLSGFLVSLPFEFDGACNLQLMPDNAMALVQIALTAAGKAKYPRYSSKLPGKGKYVLKDEHGVERVSLSEFVPVAIRSQQSTDCGEAVWALGGTRSTECQIKFAGVQSSFPNYMKQTEDNTHFFWGGELQSIINDKPQILLKLSHLDPFYNAVEKYITQIIAKGPSGYAATKSVVKSVIEQGRWMTPDAEVEAKRIGEQPLSAITVLDKRRGSELKFFGADACGKAQASKAKGAVFLLQGTCSRLQTDAVAEIVRLSSEGITGLHSVAARHELRVLPRSCSDTTEECKDAVKSDSAVFEGIAVWNLSARRDGTNFEAAEPILL
jgi:hypothetical protein